MSTKCLYGFTFYNIGSGPPRWLNLDKMIFKFSVFYFVQDRSLQRETFLTLRP